MSAIFQKFLLATIVLLIVKSASAWDAKGHVVIAEIAYLNLNTTEQIQLDNYAARIINFLPSKLRHNLDLKYPNSSNFAKTAWLADKWRDYTLSEIFAYFHAQLPQNLQKLRDTTTNNWHFTNIPDNAHIACFSASTYGIINAIDDLQQSLQQPTDLNTKALLYILLAHLIGDSYQPLHIITKFSDNCSNDRGGNDFCLQQGKYRCQLSLHRLWDQGVTLLHPNGDVKSFAVALQRKNPLSAQVKIDQSPQETIRQIITLAPFIYNTSRNTMPNESYINIGKKISSRQLTISGYKLAAILHKSLKSAQ